MNVPCFIFLYVNGSCNNRKRLYDEADGSLGPSL